MDEGASAQAQAVFTIGVDALYGASESVRDSLMIPEESGKEHEEGAEDEADAESEIPEGADASAGSVEDMMGEQTGESDGKNDGYFEFDVVGTAPGTGSLGFGSVYIEPSEDGETGAVVIPSRPEGTASSDTMIPIVPKLPGESGSAPSLEKPVVKPEGKPEEAPEQTPAEAPKEEQKQEQKEEQKAEQSQQEGGKAASGKKPAEKAPVKELAEPLYLIVPGMPVSGIVTYSAYDNALDLYNAQLAGKEADQGMKLAADSAEGSGNYIVYVPDLSGKDAYEAFEALYDYSVPYTDTQMLFGPLDDLESYKIFALLQSAPSDDPDALCNLAQIGDAEELLNYARALVYNASRLTATKLHENENLLTVVIWDEEHTDKWLMIVAQKEQ